MATPDILNTRSKAIVAFLDGRRMKGYIYNFSAEDDHFRLVAERDTAQQQGMEVHLKDLKAIFFVRDFVGDRLHAEPRELKLQNPSNKAEVTFRDGEKLVGAADAYHPQKIGFFLVPAGPRSNNLRVFVIAKNAMQIRWM